MSKYAEIIHVKKGLYGTNQKSRNAGPDHVSAILSKIEGDCKMLGEIATSLDSDGGLDSFLQNCQEDVVRSYLGPDLLQLYRGVYFDRGLGFEKMLENVKNILKVPSAEQLTKQARSEFSQLTRRTDIDESFTQFLARLNSEVKKFCTQTAYGTTLVEEQFKNSLRDLDRTFLLMLTTDKTGTDKLNYEAKMLDEKGMHKRHVSQAEVHAVNAVSQAEASVAALADTVTEFIRNESEMRRREAKLREERDQKRWAEMDSKIEALSRAHLYSQPIMNHAQHMHHAQIAPQVYPVQHTQMPQTPVFTEKVHNIQKQINPQNPIKRKPVKIPCYDCGSRFHLTEECKGDCKLTCWLCGVKGHTALAKKFHGPDAQKN